MPSDKPLLRLVNTKEFFVKEKKRGKFHCLWQIWLVYNVGVP
jgi:hypothetical protein